MSILPFQTNSITKRWMEHNHTTREVATLSLVTGALSFVAGYYQRNTCLAIGTFSFAAQQIMQRETLKGYKTPLKILSFMAFSAFVGLSLKESWSKSDSAPSNPWTAPLYLASFFATNRIDIQASMSTAQHHISQIDDGADLKLLLLIGLTASAASTFLTPRLTHFLIPAAALYPFELLDLKEKTLSESAPQFQELMKLSLYCYLGAAIGLAARYGLGPKNASPTLPLMARIPLYFHTAFFIYVFFVVYPLLLYPCKGFVVEEFKKRLAINTQGISNPQELTKSLDTHFPTRLDKIWNRVFSHCAIEIRTYRAERSYKQAYQELKDLFNK